MGYIEEIHATNKKLIAENNIHIGTLFLRESDQRVEQVEHIHPKYGWLKTSHGDRQKLPQDVSRALALWSIVKPENEGEVK